MVRRDPYHRSRLGADGDNDVDDPDEEEDDMDVVLLTSSSSSRDHHNDNEDNDTSSRTQKENALTAQQQQQQGATSRLSNEAAEAAAIRQTRSPLLTVSRPRSQQMPAVAAKYEPLPYSALSTSGAELQPPINQGLENFFLLRSFSPGTIHSSLSLSLSLYIYIYIYRCGALLTMYGHISTYC